MGILSQAPEGYPSRCSVGISSSGKVPKRFRFTTILAALSRKVSGAAIGCTGTWSPRDRKSTRLNSSHVAISYAVFCLKKKKNTKNTLNRKIKKKKQNKQKQQKNST